jgi:hypothetical protein
MAYLRDPPWLGCLSKSNEETGQKKVDQQEFQKEINNK